MVGILKENTPRRRRFIWHGALQFALHK